MIRACALAFFSSAVVDLLMAKWVVAVAAKHAYQASLLSMSVAVCILIGINATLAKKRAAPFWVLGYGLGSFLAVRFSN